MSSSSPDPDARPRRRDVVTGLLGAVTGVGGLAACTSDPPSSGGGPASSTTTGGATTPSSTSPATSSVPSAGGSATSGASTTATPAILTSDGPDIQRGPTGTNAVALTFHGAGDVALTRKVMAILADAHAFVTVFAVGQWLSATPALGRDLVAAGHDLGNHTWSHQTMPSLSAAAAATEVAKGAAAVASSVGAAGLLFRPSGTPTSTPTIRAAASAAGYHRCISYDVDPEDYADPGRDAVVSRTLAAVKDGSIVSLHLGHQGTVDALPAILNGLNGKGLRPVRLTTLLASAA